MLCYVLGVYRIRERGQQLGADLQALARNTDHPQRGGALGRVILRRYRSYSVVQKGTTEGVPTQRLQCARNSASPGPWCAILAATLTLRLPRGLMGVGVAGNWTRYRVRFCIVHGRTATRQLGTGPSHAKLGGLPGVRGD